MRRLDERFGGRVPTAVVTGETTTDVLEAIRASGLPLIPKPTPPFKLRALLMELLRTPTSETAASP